jgi:hypothetical protein
MRWTVETALDQLQRCHIKTGEATIYVSSHFPPSLLAWGAIDFLAHHRNYTITKVLDARITNDRHA